MMKEEAMAGRQRRSHRDSFTGALKVGDRVRDLNVRWYTDIDGRDPQTGGVGVIREVRTGDKLYWIRFDDGHENARGEHELEKL
jgi:hypothetical protein